MSLQTFCAGGWAMVVREREHVKVDRLVYVKGRAGAKSAVETVGETRTTSGDGLLDKHRQSRACDGSHGLKRVGDCRLVAQQRHAFLCRCDQVNLQIQGRKHHSIFLRGLEMRGIYVISDAMRYCNVSVLRSLASWSSFVAPQDAKDPSPPWLSVSTS
jgi:hypothetical protein